MAVDDVANALERLELLFSKYEVSDEHTKLLMREAYLAGQEQAADILREELGKALHG